MPPHRQYQPFASAYHRFAMTAIAVNGLDGLEASDTELRAPGPSYTADTLDRLHAIGLTGSQIFFITGADAFAEIATWHRYPSVLDQSHFIVLSRPGYPATSMPTTLPHLAGRMTSATADPPDATETAIYLVDAAMPDVSSTEVRRRLRANESIDGLVPDGVEQHIVQHRLYSGDTTAAAAPHAADHLHGQN
ncbi:MAG: nicotinate (nicotinamide) nucleotide adenylyltransferase [Acidobacteria bacterium]|nr:nicotinate (nicotinamide) nucleotide adenylyltransferase [Acidobacteriota bacterium]